VSLSLEDAYLLLSCNKSPASIRKALQTQDAVSYVEENFLSQLGQLDELKSQLQKKKLTFIAPCDPVWPKKLQDLKDEPLGLFAKGVSGISVFQAPTVAIVGTRRATTYGLRFAKDLASALATRGVTVLSGLALGVDSEAHQGALKAEGVTAGVLGCGIDIVYPRENADLFKAVENRGLILSEFEPGYPPTPSSFPRRNRIVAALADAVVVVESEARGGAMITATLAQKLGRPLFALPGRIDNPFSEGPHRLIQEGAKLVSSPQDFIDQFWSVTQGTQADIFEQDKPKKMKGPAQLAPFLEGDALLPEEFAQKTQMDFGQASATLMQLELDGFIEKRLDGRYEVREPDAVFDS